MSDFSSFDNRYYISADIVMERPLHIGKGASLEALGTDMPVIKTPEDKPYIPGSSLKGVLRTQFEKYVRTMASQNLKFNGKQLCVCDILDENRCISIEKREIFEKEAKEECKKYKKKNYDEILTQKIIENSCTACILFGSHEMASKIYIKDAFLNNGRIKTEIRDGVAIDRDTGTAKSHAKFDYEIVPAGSSFKFEVILENVEPFEIGLFGLILKLWERGEIAIGGKTSAGLGWGKLKNVELKCVEKSDIVEFLISGKKKPADLNEFVNRLRKELKKEVDVHA